MKHKFVTKNGTTVDIDVDEDDYSATVFDLAGVRIGAIECSLNETPAAPDGYYLKMTNAFLEGGNGRYLRQGIGTKCVELIIKVSGLPICVSDNNGLTQSDGSHLTGDAPAFVAKLKRLGLVFSE